MAVIIRKKVKHATSVGPSVSFFLCKRFIIFNDVGEYVNRSAGTPRSEEDISSKLQSSEKAAQ